MKKRIPIDPDIQQASEKFVRGMIAIMRAHGDNVVSDFDFHKTVYETAKYPQEIRNMKAKLDRKKAQAK
jgi:hypothetical protein